MSWQKQSLCSAHWAGEPALEPENWRRGGDDEIPTRRRARPAHDFVIDSAAGQSWPDLEERRLDYCDHPKQLSFPYTAQAQQCNEVSKSLTLENAARMIILEALGLLALLWPNETLDSELLRAVF